MVRLGVKGTWARRVRFGLAAVLTMVGMVFVVAGFVFTKKAGFRQCSGVVYEGIDVGMEGNAALSTGSDFRYALRRGTL